MAESKQPAWCWLDLEMTGLDSLTDRIIEAAVIVTSPDFSETLNEWETAVFQPPEVLASMDEWCQKTHGASGLTERVPHGITEDALDEKLAATVDQFWSEKPVILCGNSIGQDRKFVDRYLPRFASKLHYRMLDVSSFKVVFQERYDQSFPKRGTHRALDDIRESIAELQFYLQAVDVTRLS
ncbi:oligoribonuclease [Cerasicoccus arenae]|uniref:Oligoribonuclease n=1 Tax=Cerasicoccus arenae TaxID=424488 RepID=A0A8J3GDD7_9BACT|nr:oligoribonuclease [Cerasicoccus arenae]MBK1858330.1 oligoribonuclease [Cerasicoccus arenae]GHB90816.1 oligoribonuclease [Cerasicoccus arenae]